MLLRLPGFEERRAFASEPLATGGLLLVVIHGTLAPTVRDALAWTIRESSSGFHNKLTLAPGPSNRSPRPLIGRIGTAIGVSGCLV
jgi:hypothetical protein